MGACGRPTQTAPTLAQNGSKCRIESTLSEGLPDWWGKDRSRILESSISVTLNNKEIPHTFDRAKKTLGADVTFEPDTKNLLEIHFANMLGNHNWPQRFEVDVDSEGKMSLPQPLGPAPASATTRSLR